MVQSAAYFQAKGLVEKAVMLYMKGGQLKNALRLATKAKLSEYVKKIN
jgi:intraflagellar transport protein 140